MTDFEGVYALKLPNGSVKIGRSSKVLSRLARHVELAGMYGVEIEQTWPARTSQSVPVETEVLRRLKRLGGVAEINHETFTRIAFDKVIEQFNLEIYLCKHPLLRTPPVWPGVDFMGLYLVTSEGEHVCNS